MGRKKQDLSSGVTQGRKFEPLIKHISENVTHEDSIPQ
jgi:hypothetical protein